MTGLSGSSPPKWAGRLIKFFIKKDYQEEIEGDLEEVFYDDLEERGEKIARRRYALGVFKLLRRKLVKNLEGTYKLNRYGMLKNNLKIAFRVLKRDNVYSAINIVGLSSGFALSLLIVLYTQFELSYEDYNPNADRVLRLTMDYLDGGTLVDQDCETYPPMGPLIKETFSEVEQFARAYNIDEVTIKVGNDHYSETDLYAVDPSFFPMFNYPLIHGTYEGLFKDPYEAVLTKSYALKYFKKTDVVGEVIEIPYLTDPLKIVGVIPDSPPNTHFKVKILVSYETMKAAYEEKDDNWSSNNTFTFVMLYDMDKVNDFYSNLDRLNYKLTEEQKIDNEWIIAQPIKDIHLYSDKSFEPEMNGDATSVYFLLGVSFLVIFIAMVNYINLSTSKSLDRAKEVGVRKVVGAALSQLRLQFLTESFLINLLASIAAVAIISVSFDWFKYIADLPSSFEFYNKTEFWVYLGTILLVSTILSGIFPALVLSTFKPAVVLKGKLTNTTGGATFRRVLVVFQFGITMFLIVQTLTADRQLTYMREKSLGLSPERTVVVRAPHTNELKDEYQKFKSELLGRSNFESVSLSSSVPGQPSSEMSTTTDIQLVGSTEKHYFNFYIYWIDAEFMNTMKMELAAGDNFLPDSENKDVVLVNEEAIRLWGIPDAKDAIGQKIFFWNDRNPSIKGVVKNFHQSGAKSPHIPMVFMFRDGFHSLASIRVKTGDMRQHLEEIESVYKSTFPNSPFEFFFLDQEYDKQYRADEQFQLVFGTLTTFAILIACLGLFGLASFTVAKRTKEIGIRKVLGASETQIVTLLSKDFIMLVGYSMLISVPVTYFIIQRWLERYAFRIDLEFWLFALPALFVLVISFLTVFAKTFKISAANPAESLRDE